MKPQRILLALPLVLGAVLAACSSDDGTQKNPSFDAPDGGAGKPGSSGGKSSTGAGGSGTAAGGKTSGGGSGGVTGAGGSGLPGSGGSDVGTPDSGAGGTSGSTGGQSGSGGAPTPPYDCVLNPVTHLDIINACTDAVRVEKHPSLPPLPR